jgi:starch-binding outer membrane protein SusE/F
MKKVLTKFLTLSSIGLLMLSACKKSGELVTSDGGKAGTLNVTATNITLDKTRLADTTKIIKFSFNAAQYNFSAVVTNTLQIDSAGDNWVHPYSSTFSSKQFSTGFSTPDFNSLLLKIVPGNKTSQVNVRIMHALSPTVMIYSNVVNLTVTPYNLATWVYVPGAYEGSSWPNPGPMEDSLLSATDNGIYTGIINFSAGNNQFLIVPVKNWNNKWATSAPGVNPTGASVTYPVVYNGPNNFYAPVAAGNYIVTLNTNTNQLSIVPADYYSLIGSSTPGGNWSTDLWLKFINDGNNNWVGTFPMLAGEFKFRLDGQWNTSWGPGAAAGSAVTSGAIGDGNIPLSPAGTYKFTFTNPPTATGGGVNPLGTTTFTATKQ